MDLTQRLLLVKQRIYNEGRFLQTFWSEFANIEKVLTAEFLQLLVEHKPRNLDSFYKTFE